MTKMIQSIQRSSSHPCAQHVQLRKQFFRIAMWNVRTLYKAGKIYNCIREMEKMNNDIIGLAEGGGTDAEVFEQDKNKLIFSGDGKHQNGVGFLTNKKIYKS